MVKRKDNNREPAEEWDDYICNEISKENNFPKAAQDLAAQKKIINRFLNFYLGGKPQKGLTVGDIVFATISIIPMSDKYDDFLFYKSHFSDDGTIYFLSPEDKLKSEFDSLMNVSLENKTKPNHEPLEPKEVKENDSGPVKNNELRNQHFLNKNDGKGMVIESKVNNKDENMRSVVMLNNEEKAGLPRFTRDVSWVTRENINIANHQSETRQYGPVENSAFILSCNKLLQEWETNFTARIVLRRFFGLVAATLMRSVTKTYQHLVNTFASVKYLDLLKFCDDHIVYAAPHKECIKFCCRYLKKYPRPKKISVMFAKLAVNCGNTGVMRALLYHTADYAMGLVSMLAQINRQYVEDDWLNGLVEATYSEDTAASWKILDTFLKEYMSTPFHRTQRWARIIDDRYFSYLSCSRNYALAVILAVFVERMANNSSVWKSTWVQNEDLDTYKEIGAVMFEKYKTKTIDKTVPEKESVGIHSICSFAPIIFDFTGDKNAEEKCEIKNEEMPSCSKDVIESDVS